MHPKEPTSAGPSTEALSTEKHPSQPSIIPNAPSPILIEPNPEANGNKETDPTPAELQELEEKLTEMHSSPGPSSLSTMKEPRPSSSGCGPDGKQSEGCADNEHPKEHSTEPAMAGPSSIPDEMPSTLNAPSSSRCVKHDKDFKGYCSNCDKLICMKCVFDGSHEFHEIATLATIHQKRQAKTKEKIEELEKSLQNDPQNNLEMLQKQERSICEQIDSVCAEQKQCVSHKIEERKRTIQMPLEFLNKKQKLTESLQLPPVEFLQQQPDIDKQLDEMLADPASRAFVPEHFDDIGCELIPPYEMHSIQLDKFDTIDVWSQHINVCGNSWTIALRRRDSLIAKITPPTEELLKFPFELLVVIIHREWHKAIKKTYTITRGTLTNIEIITIDQLKSEGFIENSILAVKIGLRPLNALVVINLLKQQLDLMMNNWYIMNFVVKKKDSKINRESYISPNLTDSADRQWRLRVHYVEVFVPKKNCDLQAFIELNKGTSTKCRYFIELLHEDSNKNVRHDGEKLFEEEGNKQGWRRFVDQHRLLNDPGFNLKSILRFRFGVSPIEE